MAEDVDVVTDNFGADRIIAFVTVFIKCLLVEGLASNINLAIHGSKGQHRNISPRHG